MADLTPKHKTRGLDFANRLAEMAAAAPDVRAKSAVYSVVKSLRELYGFSDQEKCELIRRSLDLGCSTYDDLVRETKMHRPTVIELVKSMETAGIVSIYYMQRGERGGRPTAYIRLTLVKSP